VSSSRTLRAALCSLAFPALSACSATHGHLHEDARDLLDRGRSIEALEILVKDEPYALRASRCERLRYALTRGVTHLTLGDVAEGATWIERAQADDAAMPRCLVGPEKGRLASALRSLPPEPIE
jgi:hypothetical protein